METKEPGFLLLLPECEFPTLSKVAAIDARGAETGAVVDVVVDAGVDVGLDVVATGAEIASVRRVWQAEVYGSG